MSSPAAFTQADFAKWNETTSVFHLSKKLVGKNNIPQVRAAIIQAIGEKKVRAVQALANFKYRVEFRSSAFRHYYDINGLSFRGVTVTPHPAYEEVKQVFIDQAPLQMPDQCLYDVLAPYGRIVIIKHLTVRGFSNIKSGTRMVSMVLTKAIPRAMVVAGFPLFIKYSGQPQVCFLCGKAGHVLRKCHRRSKPVDQAARSNASNHIASGSGNAGVDQGNATEQASSEKQSGKQGKVSLVKAVTAKPTQLQKGDARIHLNAVRKKRAASPKLFPSSGVGPCCSKDLPDSAISSDRFEVDLPPLPAPSKPTPSAWSSGFSRSVSGRGNKLAVTVRERRVGKTQRVSSSSEEEEARFKSPHTRKPRSKRRRRATRTPRGSDSEAEVVKETATSNIHPGDMGDCVKPAMVEDALDGTSVVDPLAAEDPTPEEGMDTSGHSPVFSVVVEPETQATTSTSTITTGKGIVACSGVGRGGPGFDRSTAIAFPEVSATLPAATPEEGMASCTDVEREGPGLDRSTVVALAELTVATPVLQDLDNGVGGGASSPLVSDGVSDYQLNLDAFFQLPSFESDGFVTDASDQDLLSSALDTPDGPLDSADAGIDGGSEARVDATESSQV